jgi:NADPH:quinone reductase-like Zn-dependent oxidoreductase
MRALQFRTYGGPEVLEWAEAPEPHAGPGQIRIAVHAASVNPIDWKVISGVLSGGKPMQGTGFLGYDAAGVVDEVGIDAGDTLLVDGGAGGVGAVAVQMALARGAKVIASSSEANHNYLRELGATPVRYGQGLAERVRAAAGGPVDAVLDVAGKTPVQDLISLVPEPSQVVTIANYAAGQAGARVTGGGADSHPMQALALTAELLAQNKLVIKVQTFPLDRAAEAYRISQSGHVRGKLVLVP